MGAGVIPFAIHDGKVLFLFHTTFQGRRAGHLVDFGGGGEPGETHRETAIREFVEETETMFLDTDPASARRTPGRVEEQAARLAACFDRTLGAHPDWFCGRTPDKEGNPRHWRTFFVDVGYRELEPMNRAWEVNPDGRFAKRRKLFWVPAEELLSIFHDDPDRLWKRLRQMPGAPAVIEAIVAQHKG